MYSATGAMAKPGSPAPPPQWAKNITCHDDSRQNIATARSAAYKTRSATLPNVGSIQLAYSNAGMSSGNSGQGRHSMLSSSSRIIRLPGCNKEEERACLDLGRRRVAELGRIQESVIHVRAASGRAIAAAAAKKGLSSSCQAVRQLRLTKGAQAKNKR